MLKITRLNDSQIEIEHEVSTEDFEVFFKKALAQFKENAELPGFRNGTAPEKIILEKVGENKILNAAAEEAIKENWRKIIIEERLQPLGQPEVMVMKLARGNPLVFKIKTAELPAFELPDYKNIARAINAAPKENTEVSAEEVLNTLETLKKENPKFLENAKNEESLKDSVKKNLEYEKERRGREKLRMDILDAVSKETKIALPEILLESEVGKMLWELQNSLKDMGLLWPQYLEHIKKTEVELKAGWKGDAERRVKFGLILRDIALKENLAPLDELLDKKTDEILLGLDEAERKKASRENLREHLFGRLQNEMVFEMLEGEK